jgi:hypothetical protein
MPNPNFPAQIVAIPLQKEPDKFLVLILNPNTNNLTAAKVDATANRPTPAINNTTGGSNAGTSVVYP